jgi:hypothetical protein
MPWWTQESARSLCERNYRVACDYGNLKQSGIAPFAAPKYDFSGIHLIALAEAQPSG